MRYSPHVKSRAGITLTEILISLLIMAIGMISLATLFPLGLLRIREAQRQERSSMLTQTAIADSSARNLLNPASFEALPWYQLLPGPYLSYDPWVQDLPLPNPANVNALGFVVPNGIYRGWGLDGEPHNPASTPPHPSEYPLPGTGLPVAYDPLWWEQINQTLGYIPNNAADHADP